MEGALAHVRKEADYWHEHLLLEHSEGVATLAEGFANEFGAGGWARLAGLWHDLGKYQPAWQQYLKGKTGYHPDATAEGVGRVNHAAAGAVFAQSQAPLIGKLLAYIIAGHHAGLADGSDGTQASLRYRLEVGGIAELDGARENEEAMAGMGTQPLPAMPRFSSHFAIGLWTRMLFSCLVDADFLDTEWFMNPAQAIKRGGDCDLTLQMWLLSACH